MHGDFLRTEDGYNVYELDCPGCKTVGEVGVPKKHYKVFLHECGTMFLQKATSGKNLYEKPRLETVSAN